MRNIENAKEWDVVYLIRGITIVLCVWTDYIPNSYIFRIYSSISRGVSFLGFKPKYFWGFSSLYPKWIQKYEIVSLVGETSLLLYEFEYINANREVRFIFKRSEYVYINGQTKRRTFILVPFPKTKRTFLAMNFEIWENWIEIVLTKKKKQNQPWATYTSL